MSVLARSVSHQCKVHVTGLSERRNREEEGGAFLKSYSDGHLSSNSFSPLTGFPFSNLETIQPSGT